MNQQKQNSKMPALNSKYKIIGNDRAVIKRGARRPPHSQAEAPRFTTI